MRRRGDAAAVMAAHIVELQATLDAVHSECEARGVKIVELQKRVAELEKQ